MNSLVVGTARSNHFNGSTFHNPNHAGEKTFGELIRMIRQRSPARWPTFLPNTPRKELQLPESDNVRVTFIGQSTFLLQLGPTNILTDPVFSQRASPMTWLGPKRVRPPGILLHDLPPIHLLLLSHNHYDHLDLPSLRQLHETFNPSVVTPLGNRTLLRKAGLENIVELDWWQSHEFKTIRITVTPAQHFSARHFWDRNKSLWGGFMLEDSNHSIFFAGDTGYADHFKEIAARFSSIDLALLPIGAFEPRWFMKDLHMNPEEAVQAFVDLKAKQALGMHFGTFQLTDEAIDEPVRQLQHEMEKRKLERFSVLDFGETICV